MRESRVLEVKALLVFGIDNVYLYLEHSHGLDGHENRQCK